MSKMLTGTFLLLSGEEIAKDINLEFAYSIILNILQEKYNYDDKSLNVFIKVIKDTIEIEWYNLIDYDKSTFNIIIIQREDSEINYYNKNHTFKELLRYDKNKYFIKLINYMQLTLFGNPKTHELHWILEDLDILNHYYINRLIMDEYYNILFNSLNETRFWNNLDKNNIYSLNIDTFPILKDLLNLLNLDTYRYFRLHLSKLK
jgi:hypothetical protein